MQGTRRDELTLPSPFARDEERRDTLLSPFAAASAEGGFCRRQELSSQTKVSPDGWTRTHSWCQKNLKKHLSRNRTGLNSHICITVWRTLQLLPPCTHVHVAPTPGNTDAVSVSSPSTTNVDRGDRSCEVNTHQDPLISGPTTEHSMSHQTLSKTSSTQDASSISPVYDSYVPVRSTSIVSTPVKHQHPSTRSMDRNFCFGHIQR